MAKILLVEDDLYLRRDLRILLQNEGYEVLPAGSLKEAAPLFLAHPETDLCLLDLWLPDGDGFEFLEKFRAKSHAPVVMLTACDDEQSVIRGLDLGADDYITKPFRKAELVSRIRAQLRRSSYGREETILQADALVLNPFTHEVHFGTELIPLQPVSFRLLQLFMENPGILFTRERLLAELDGLNGDEPVGDNTLSVHISRLRKALPKGTIETVRGFGYRFSLDAVKIQGGRK